MSAGSKLRDWRARKGLSQTDAARMVGVSQSSLSAYETGAKTPGVAVAQAIEQATRGAVRIRDWIPARRPRPAASP